jgi:hypothetical protein
MKKIYILLIVFMSCGSDKIYNKKLQNDEIKIDWYHYSYISSKSPNYVEVRKEDEKELIYEDLENIQDIELNNDTITILHLKFNETPKIKKESVFGYSIEYKEVSSHEMYLKYLKKTNQK